MVVDLVRRFIIMEDCVPKGEAVWDVIPNIDPVPPIGCFCARLMDNSAREDWKLDPKNQSGVFLGFAHRRNIYGAQILVDKAIITAKHQIAYDVELFPFLARCPAPLLSISS